MTALTIIKSVHLSRDAVYFSMVGTISVYFGIDLANSLLWILLLDLAPFVLLWVMKPTWESLVYVWAALMSILLPFYFSLYIGNTPITASIIVIILLSICELLTIIKIGYDILRNQVRSWTSEAE